jgi:hypothetical protein
MAPADWEPEPTQLRFVLEREDDPGTRVEDESSFLVRGGHHEDDDD